MPNNALIPTTAQFLGAHLKSACDVMRNSWFNSSCLRLAALGIPAAKTAPPKKFQKDG
jgi:hypothetical protein